ncbi:MAG: phospho-sugar mutase [Anaerovibrio sp.]|uniref:phospho-sugar mutase n=1 Tax=Anaerovibrio sp. TaxID=1872532 RepID=UPI0025CEF909|nr:phospho-sugar mutase [Anaerovibrio sp.]MCR5176501.1 phospho-sugar mutase [Anaerovibrio sp.]
MDNNLMDRYSMWHNRTGLDETLRDELDNMSEKDIEDAFYRDLAFGTGGLRGIIGAGTNRMNIYTVGRASQGLADYLKKNFSSPAVVIGYDSRINSRLFAQRAATVFSANGVRVYLWKQLMPVPTVSFATRKLGTSAGVMITASHNPARYNGYKVYGEDGCQITTDAATKILAEINKLDIFDDVKNESFDSGMTSGNITYIDDDVYTAYIEEVKKQSVLGNCKIDKNVDICYTPLNGTGLKPVVRALREGGYTNVTVVKEQAEPDGQFPTCPYPNPEIKEAMAIGIECARQSNAELLLATDPDCDRVGIAVRNRQGEYVLLSGNETGLLLFDYICSRRQANGTMPEAPIMIKTIVTMDLGERIAEHYGVKVKNVLTGFKFIGEQIGLLEKAGKADSYIFGFEESYGYLTGSYVRDKDGVNASYMICEMFAYYKSLGVNLLDKLNEIYDEYGYCLNTLHSFEFDGASGFNRMQSIMEEFHGGVKSIGPKRVVTTLDYSKGLEGLPKSDVLKFMLEDNCSVVVRPSGTEPKLKAYISVSAATRKLAEQVEKDIAGELKKYFMA